MAELGPHHPRRWVREDEVRSPLATPTDPGLLDDVAEHDADDGPASDPWSAR